MGAGVQKGMVLEYPTDNPPRPLQPPDPQPLQPPPRPVVVMHPRHSEIIVAAIDFGTTYTGFGFSFFHEYQKDKLQMHIQNWHNVQGTTQKTPTAALFDNDMKLLYFGHEAETEFTQLDETNRKQCFYFQQFKMNLYRNSEKDDSPLEQIKLKPYNKKEEKLASEVFYKVIEYLKNELLRMLNGSDTKQDYGMDMIRWVLTVPAIWDDQAKLFMRNAAQKAGINEEKLTLALEPEAAALLVRHLNLDMKIGYTGQSVFSPLNRQSTFMVADIGGGTLDITVYRQHEDGTLQELHRAIGGHSGGTVVDEAFRMLIRKIYGAPTYQEAIHQDPVSMLDLQHHFEQAKRMFDPEKKRSVRIQIPAILRQTLEEEVDDTFDNYIKNCAECQNGISFVASHMVIESDRFEKLYEHSLDAIIQQIDDLLNNCAIGNVDAIILVGGYAESSLLQKSVKDYFAKQSRIIIPPETSLSVLKGAVLFGHEPLAINSRICKYTYGIAVTVPFVDGQHDPKKQIQIGNEKLCDHVFEIHLKRGDRVGINIDQKEHQCTPNMVPASNTMAAIVEVYASTSLEPKYTTDPGCFRIGSVCIPLSACLTQTDQIFVKLLYHGTEMAVVVREAKTGKITPGRFYFPG